MGLGLFNITQAADLLSQKNQQLNGVNSKIAALKKNLQITESQRSQLLQTLKETDKQMAKITIELQTLSQQMVEKQAALSALKEQLVSLEENLAYQKKILGKQLRASYQLGQYEYFQLLLNQQDPTTMLRLTTYYHYINLARVKTLTRIQNTETEIKNRQNVFAAEVEQLNHLALQEQEKKAILLQNQQKRQQIITKLSQQIQSQSSQLKEYEGDKKQLEALVIRLKKASIAAAEASVPKSGKLVSSASSGSATYVPFSGTSFSKAAHHLNWPTQGKLLNRTAFPVLRNEPGIVILAPEGQHVVSVYPGKVVFADALKGFGLLIIVDHGQGFMTLYANNQTLYRKRGDNVKAGDLIANVGHTGILPQSGLYFEIRYNGKPLNPLQWLAPPRKL